MPTPAPGAAPTAGTARRAIPIAAAPAAARGASAVVLGIIGMVMFAATLPATRLALEGLSPLFVTAGRAVLAAALSAGLLAFCKIPRPRGGALLFTAAVSLCLVIGFPLLSGLAMTFVGASHGGVVLAIMPIATASAAVLVGNERPSLAFCLLSLVGAALVLGFTLSESGLVLEPGDLFLLAAAVTAGFGYAFSGKLARSVPGWSVIAWALLFSLPLTLTLSVISAPAEWPTAPSVWAGFVYLGAVSMFLGFVFWNAAMALGGIAKIGQIQLLQPFVTIAIAAVVGGEVIRVREVGFAVAVVLVVMAAQRTRVRSDRQPVPPAG